jgi:hypothetical protein
MSEDPRLFSTFFSSVIINVSCPSYQHRWILTVFGRNCVSELRFLMFMIMISMSHLILVLVTLDRYTPYEMVTSRNVVLEYDVLN